MLGKARFAHIKALAAALLDTLNLEPNVGVVHNWGKGRTLGNGNTGTLDNWLGNDNTNSNKCVCAYVCVSVCVCVCVCV